MTNGSAAKYSIPPPPPSNLLYDNEDDIEDEDHYYRCFIPQSSKIQFLVILRHRIVNTSIHPPPIIKGPDKSQRHIRGMAEMLLAGTNRTKATMIPTMMMTKVLTRDMGMLQK